MSYFNTDTMPESLKQQIKALKTVLVQPPIRAGMAAKMSPTSHSTAFPGRVPMTVLFK